MIMAITSKSFLLIFHNVDNCIAGEGLGTRPTGPVMNDWVDNVTEYSLQGFDGSVCFQ